MNRITKRCMLVVVLISAASAAVHKVPEDRPTIQGAINELANDGDTISVWGETIPASTTSISSATRACLLSTEVFCQDEVERNLSRRLVIGE